MLVMRRNAGIQPDARRIHVGLNKGEAKNALAEGQFPLRVAPKQNDGSRYPIFQYYGNLPYTVGGLLHHVGFTSSIPRADKPELTAKIEKLKGGAGFTGDYGAAGAV